MHGEFLKRNTELVVASPTRKHVPVIAHNPSNVNHEKPNNYVLDVQHVWKEPFLHTAPKLGWCRRTASRIGGTGGSARRTHAIHVVGQNPYYKTR